MTNRREFLRAASVAAFPGLAAAAERDTAARHRTEHIAVHAILIDTRHAEARSVGARLAAAGSPVHAISDGDVTQVWWRHIRPAWAREPLTVAGVTERPALFCLEQLASACRLRVVFHGEHTLHTIGRTQHQVWRGAEAADLSRHDLRRAGPLWPTLIANAIATSASCARHPRFGLSDAARAPVLPDGARLLTSWVIAAA